MHAHKLSICSSAGCTCRCSALSFYQSGPLPLQQPPKRNNTRHSAVASTSKKREVLHLYGFRGGNRHYSSASDHRDRHPSHSLRPVLVGKEKGQTWSLDSQPTHQHQGNCGPCVYGAAPSSSADSDRLTERLGCREDDLLSPSSFALRTVILSMSA